MRKKALIVFLALLLFGATICKAELRFTEDADSIEKAADSVFMLEIYSKDDQKIGVGSGFVAFDGSFLVTNYHVIEDGAYVVAISDDYDYYVLDQICVIDKIEDIAILLFEENINAKPLELDGDSELKRSQPVVAIGSPAGLMNTVSIGNISAFYKREGKEDWIQFTAPISSGSSGGALLNDEGKVIGITTATYASTQNINMAVKASTVLKLYSSWDKMNTIRMNGKYAPGINVLYTMNAQQKKQNTVYVSKSGKKYHNNPTCSGMQNAIEMDLLDAIENGYDPCGKCYK